MNEQEFRRALRTTMSAVTAPPPMSDGPVLDLARRMQRRRRAYWAGAGSAAAVAVIAVGVVVVAPGSGEQGPPVGSGGVATTERPAPNGGSSAVPGTSVPESGEDTETSWPNGQTDRTARNGPRYDQGVTLLDQLTLAVPSGYESPDLPYGDPSYSGDSLRNHQASYNDTVDGVEVWEYTAAAPVVQGEGVGKLLAVVATPGNPAAGDGCDLAPTLWGYPGECTEVTVAGERVGVFTATETNSPFDQWAGYRHPDGTVVFVAQGLEYAGSAKPPLTALPLTAEQLAEQAADPRYHLD